MLTSQLIVYFLIQLLANGVISNQQKSARIETNGPNQIVLGGLFPVHAEGTGGDNRCGPIMLERGIQRLEAMLYAIDQINNNSRDWKFKIGAVVLDTCSSESYALEQSRQFLHYSSGSKADISRKVTAVVGASNSKVSLSVANVFRSFKIPQVSYASTSEELDDEQKYPYFFRVVPSDKFQVEVILDILERFQWTYVSMVVSKGEYGENAVLAIQKKIQSSEHYHICLAAVETLPRNATQKHYDDVVNILNSFESAKVAIVFLNEDKIRNLLEACERLKIPQDRFIWIGSDSWGTKERIVQGHEKLAVMSITISPKRFPLEEGFDEYFKSLNPNNNDRNPWFKEFWENRFNCVFSNETTARSIRSLCTGSENLSEIYRQDALVPMVVDSVYLLARAARTMCERFPRFCREPEKMDERDRAEYLEIIRHTSFNSSQGKGMVIKFDNARSIPVNYTIFQFRSMSHLDSLPSYKIIGDWDQNKRLRILRLPSWAVDGEIVSRCSEECPDGQERIPVSKIEMRCCWACRPCHSGYHLPDPRKPCERCSGGTVPSSDKMSCIEQRIKYVGLNLTSAWSLVPLVFSILGIISTSVVLVIFFLHRKTPIIVASGRELCYFILVGIIVNYCCSFVALLEPTEVSCGALRIGIGLGLSICYSAIFTKVSLRQINGPSNTSPGSQIAICMCLVLIQVFLTVLWLIITPTDVPIQFIEAEGGWVTFCRLDGISLLFGLVYNMVLLILCTIYAFKTRNILENFNETKWISFTMYASCIIWLAFIPIYFSAVKDYTVQSNIMAMSVSFGGTVILVCMFLPKIYIVIFHPARNPATRTETSSNGPSVRYSRDSSKTQDQLQQPSLS